MNSSKLINTQNIIMNNINDTKCDNIDFIWDNINTCDEHIIKKMNKLLSNDYQEKINLIYLLLNSNSKLPLKNHIDIITFFNFLSPLNNEFSFASYNWNYKIIKNDNDNILFIQNSINKSDSCSYLYNKYINLIKNILVISNIQFNYFEFKCNRFYKSKDIIFVFDIKQFNIY